MDRALLDRLQQARAAKRGVAVVTDLRDGRQVLTDGATVLAGEAALAEERLPEITAIIAADKSGRLETAAAHDLFVQVFNPPLRMIIVGAVHIAQSLAPMAALAGYEVTIVDPRRAWASAERFPGLTLVNDWPDDALSALELDHRCAVVTLTHDPKLDDPALDVALRTPVFYIGCLGSRKTHAARLERLEARGLSRYDLGRLHGPAGLAIGAKSPAEIAISILAQVTQVLRGAPPLVKPQPRSAAEAPVQA